MTVRRYVDADRREDWARSRGCVEMASDALADDRRSVDAHVRCGYERLEMVTQFRKRL